MRFRMDRKWLTLVLLLLVGVAGGADWPSFRGPRGDGTSAERGLPIKWGPGENVVWRTPLPGPGTSSPIVCKGRIFLTCYTGHGVVPGGAVADLRRHLLCVDRENG